MNTIHQIVTFKATPKQIYDLLMNAKLHSAFTGDSVIMSNDIEGKFSVFGGYCTGYNIDLVVNGKIVQAWNFKEDGWPEDHYSICTFIFKEIGSGCQLDFTQTKIPEHKVNDLREGWNEYYWKPMKNYLDKL